VVRTGSSERDDYIAIPLSADERQRLDEVARHNERSITQEVRWRLRRLLRAPRSDPATRAEPAA
jgi:hypothetical protein